VTAVSAGIAVITVHTESGNRTATCTATVDAQRVVARPTPPADGRGVIEVLLDVPVNEPFSVSFTLTLPAGFSLNRSGTTLASELLGSHQLAVAPADAGSWLFAVTPQTSLLGAGETVYRQVVHIAYTLDGTAAAGEHKVKISNIDLTQSNSGATVHQDEISVTVTLTDATGAQPVEASEIVYYNGILTVNTPQSERIEVYSVSGQRLYVARKEVGKATFDLNGLPLSVLIVYGGSGWVKKIVK
jgi:hypothetical protein